jgi:kynurenine formamidase
MQGNSPKNMKKEFKILDLTHTITPETPHFDGGCQFELHTVIDYKDCTPPNLFRVQKIETKAGIGTHMDAPAHIVKGGKTIESLELNNLVTDCVVIRVDNEVNEKYVIMPSVVEKFEEEHGKITPNSFVIFYTGWEQYWNNPEKFINDHMSPSLHISTGELLLERNIAGIGIDTLSIDSGAEDFPLHRLILGAGKYLVENVANAKELPPIGATIFVLPMKMKGATEAPIRLIALI